jgi:phosphosulfolactate synthase
METLETGGEYIDFAKIAVGMFRLQTEGFLKRKIAAYHDAKCKVFFAGDVSEAAFIHGVSRQYYQTAKQLGADAIEVSSAQVSMSLADKCELIKMAKQEGLLVIAEIGQKGHEEWTNSQSYIVEQIRAYQKAGAWKVLFQDEGISRGVSEMKTDLVLNVVAQFDVQEFLFQFKVPQAQLWLVSTFGNNVNLDIDSHQVLEVELMRRGIRGRGAFGLVGALEQSAVTESKGGGR